MKLISLKNLPLEPVSHNPEIKKQVIIKKGQIPSITQIARAVFKPNQVAPAHTHQDMYEVFIVEKGSGKAILDGEEIKLGKGMVLTVEQGESHEIINNSQESLIVLTIGIKTTKKKFVKLK